MIAPKKKVALVLKLTQFQVDALGNISKVNHETRLDFSQMKAQK